MQEQLFPPITFFNSDKQTCYLLQQSLQSLPNVSFAQEDILEIKQCDCVIFPCYTSFGFSNAVNDQFEQHLGNALTNKITKKIKSKYYGEQVPGSSFVVSIDESDPLNANNAGAFKYLVWTCVVGFGQDETPIASYNAVRSAFLAISKHNRTHTAKQIKRVACPLFHRETFTLVPSGRHVRDIEMRAEIMAKALDTLYKAQTQPKTTQNVKKRYKALTTTQSTESIEEPQLEQLALSGALETRKFATKTETQKLIDWIATSDNQELSIAACKALATLLRHQEFTDSYDVTQQLLENREAFRKVFRLAKDGLIEVHTTITKSEIEFGDCIGKGASTYVYRGTYKGKEVAIKQFLGDLQEIPEGLKEVHAEVATLSLLRHPLLLPCYGACLSSPDFFIVTELRKENLQSLLETTPIELSSQIVISRKIAAALAFLHGYGVIHRDLKSFNVLMKSCWHMKQTKRPSASTIVTTLDTFLKSGKIGRSISDQSSSDGLHSSSSMSSYPSEDARMFNKKSMVTRVPTSLEQNLHNAQEFIEKQFSEMEKRSHTIKIFGERYLLLRAKPLTIDFYHHSDTANKLLFDVSHILGKVDARMFSKKCKLDPMDRICYCPVLTSFMGWSSVEILQESNISFDDKACILIQCPYTFESKSLIGEGAKTHSPACILNSGYISGWFSEVTGESVVASEISCVAKGDDKCFFVMAPVDKIETVIKRYAEDDSIVSSPRFLSKDNTANNAYLKRSVKKLTASSRRDSISPLMQARKKVPAMNRDHIRSTITDYFAQLSRNPMKAKANVGRERYIYVRAGGLSSEFFKLMSELYEDEEESKKFSIQFLFNFSYFLGTSDVDFMSKTLSLKQPIEQLNALRGTMEESGWSGIMVLPTSNFSTAEDQFSVAIKVDQSCEAESWGKSSSPVCFLCAGYIAGWASNCFSIPLKVVEGSCKAMGDPCCTFLLAAESHIMEVTKTYLTSLLEFNKDAMSRLTNVKILSKQ